MDILANLIKLRSWNVLHAEKMQSYTIAHFCRQELPRGKAHRVPQLYVHEHTNDSRQYMISP